MAKYKHITNEMLFEELEKSPQEITPKGAEYLKFMVTQTIQVFQELNCNDQVDREDLITNTTVFAIQHWEKFNQRTGIAPGSPFPYFSIIIKSFLTRNWRKYRPAGEMQPKIIFDDGSVEFVLEALGNKIDEEGYIAEQDGTRVKDPGGAEILATELGGIRDKKFIKGDLASIMKIATGEW